MYIFIVDHVYLVVYQLIETNIWYLVNTFIVNQFIIKQVILIFIIAIRYLRHKRVIHLFEWFYVLFTIHMLFYTKNIIVCLACIISGIFINFIICLFFYYLKVFAVILSIDIQHCDYRSQKINFGIRFSLFYLKKRNVFIYIYVCIHVYIHVYFIA